MTANTLSNKERATVASAVTGKEHRLKYISGAPMVANYADVAFCPDFAGIHRDRSQALALVEWLTDRIMKSIDGQDNYFRQLLSAIHWRDTAALEYMAHQMITKGKEDD